MPDATLPPDDLPSVAATPPAPPSPVGEPASLEPETPSEAPPVGKKYIIILPEEGNAGPFDTYAEAEAHPYSARAGAIITEA